LSYFHGAISNDDFVHCGPLQLFKEMSNPSKLSGYDYNARKCCQTTLGLRRFVVDVSTSAARANSWCRLACFQVHGLQNS